MSASLVISIIVALLIFSLVFSAISYNRQLAIKRRQAKIRKCRQQADENLGLQYLLLKIDPEFPLILLLQKHIIHDLQAAHNLSPQDPALASHLNKQKNLMTRYQAGERNCDIQTHVTTDAELSQAQFQLTQISKMVEIHQNRGELQLHTCRELVDYIKNLKLNLDINTHMHQARRYGENNDISMYQMHIKLARDVLKKSPLDIDNKTERIKELSEILKEVKRTNKVVLETTEPDKAHQEASTNKKAAT